MTSLVESLLVLLWGMFTDFFGLFTAEMVVSNLLGAMVGFLVSRHFALKSGKELREEAAELQRLNSILIFGVQSQGKFEVEINSEGKIVTVNRIELNGTLPPITGEMSLSSSKPDKKGRSRS